ncbi:MAG: pilus assembly protein TadG-related protein [Beijerinckiaceae bacterium]
MAERSATVSRLLKGFLGRGIRDEHGGIVVGFATAAVGLLVASGVAVDYSNTSSVRSKLQSVADSSSLAGAREFRLGNASETVLKEAVINYAKAALPDIPTLTVTPSVDLSSKTISVRLNATIPTYLLRYAGQHTTEIAASAKARMVGGAPICVIGLDQNENSTLDMEKNAKLTAPNCSIYSNSKKPNGLSAKNSAQIRAAFICSAGGKSNAKPDSFIAEPRLDCPVIPDPLASRMLPSASGCIATAMVVKGSMLNLSPGTYCGGLTISDNAKVNFNTGVYIFKDGPLLVTTGATLTGVNVGLHFTGPGAVVRFDALSTISLTAPKVGDLAGLLITEDRGASTANKHDILSNNARTLLGTIYLPRGRLQIGANNPVADQSAYTIIVARLFTLSEGPNMVLNTNFGATDIPVPAGVGPDGQTKLIE